MPSLTSLTPPNAKSVLGLVSGRVSLIVPIYNVDMYINDFVNSILAQSYKNLEVILVNDGATDNTAQILRDSVPQLEAEGYLVKLIVQANKGLGGAVDSGLKHFTGEFLMWPDPDDWLLPNSVERRVDLMRQNEHIGLLRSNAHLFIENRQEFDGSFMPETGEQHSPIGLLEDLLFLRNYHSPVCHMVRSAMFLQVHPDRSIYFTSVSSQNFQLLVPFVEAFPVLQVHESLAVYRVREDSRSRAPRQTGEKLMARFEQLLDLSKHTIPKMKTFSYERQKRLQNFYWRNLMLPTAFRALMRARCLELIEDSALSTGRKVVACCLVCLQCNPVFRAMDTNTGRIASRLLARSFDKLVKMPEQQVVWGAGPLWTAT